MMDWSNEMVLQFLQCYEDEPIIWNPNNENHKKKNLIHDAWRRIKNNLPWECSVNELKKKKDSLMAYYRFNLAKIRKSQLSGAEDDDIFTTNWFAFPTMDSFLRPVYENNTTTENFNDTSDSESGENSDSDSDDIKLQLSSIPKPAITQQRSSVESNRQPIRRKQIDVANEVSASGHKTNDAFKHIKRNKTSEPPHALKTLNEYEMFGNLVASKIQKIKNPLDREILMNDINNLIFNAVKSSMISQPCSKISCTSEHKSQRTLRPQSRQSITAGSPTSQDPLQYEVTYLHSQDLLNTGHQELTPTKPQVQRPKRRYAISHDSNLTDKAADSTSNVAWTNEMVLEFLQCYEDEPIIWNPFNENHKKKNLVKDAWCRIKNNLSWECSVGELKKKKDSLMAYYRIHVSKIKKSKLSDEDVYTTNWFAFETMDNFLRPVYESNRSIYIQDGNDTITTQSGEKSDSDYEEIELQTSNGTKPYRQMIKKEASPARHQPDEAIEHEST